MCLSNRHLNLILLSTEACNLRCTYCFEKFARGRMEPRIVQGVKCLLDRRRQDLEILNLSWFGGEPLLAMDVVREISTHAMALFGGREGVHFSSNMTTNAMLLSRTRFEELLGLGVKAFYITFDGPRESHDAKRMLPNGQGAFDTIWDNVLALREVEGDFEIVLRLHVDAENQESMAPFIETCKATFGQDPRFNLCVQMIKRLGGAQDQLLPVLERNEASSIIARLRCLANPDQVASSKPELSICYASWANSFIIRADGSINKCSVAVDHPNNSVGRLEADGRMKLDSTMIAKWMRGIFSGKPEELECPMLGLADTRKSG
ncbi:MAG: radical SAM protein [Planctomycetota bacterium]